MAAAFRGTRTERNTAMSSSTEMATTEPMNQGNRSLSWLETSAKPATEPPRRTVVPVRSSICGSTSLRRSSTSVAVASSCGLHSGIAVTMAASPSALRSGGLTEPIPSVAARVACRSVTATVGSSLSVRSVTARRVPLNPGPKASLRRSYARRVVRSVDSAPASEKPMRRAASGTARARSRTRLAKAYRTGWLPTWCAHRPAKVDSTGRLDALSRRRRVRAVRPSMRCPTAPRSAGSRVTAASTDSATTMAVP